MAKRKGVPQKHPSTSPEAVAARKRAFLDALRITGNHRMASEAAGVNRNLYKREWLEKDEAFAAEYAEAKEEAIDRLEEEAHRRAVQGVRKLKFHEGAMILVPLMSAEGVLIDKEGQPLEEGAEPVMVPYIEHEYSDTLLIFLLKGNNPEKFKDRIDHTSKDEGLKFYMFDPTAPPPESA